ncbi:MAG: hypothetical protein KKD69_04880 [Euryarchaeota archaeon]|nr:hypothetical protein [Euryarchaeota archaeon]
MSLSFFHITYSSSGLILAYVYFPAFKIPYGFSKALQRQGEIYIGSPPFKTHQVIRGLNVLIFEDTNLNIQQLIN